MSKEEFVNSIMARFKPVTIDEADIEKEKQQKKDRLEAEFMLNVPTIFKNGLNFEYNKQLTETTNNVDKSVLSNELLISPNIILYGLYGTGKTHTAYSIAKELYINSKIKTWRVVREIEIINELRENSLAGKEFIGYDYLVIDEFGKVSDTDFVKAQIFNILDNRNDWKRKTVIICNARDHQEVRTIVSNAIGDRYKKHFYFYGGKSKRK